MEGDGAAPVPALLRRRGKGQRQESDAGRHRPVSDGGRRRGPGRGLFGGRQEGPGADPVPRCGGDGRAVTAADQPHRQARRRAGLAAQLSGQGRRPPDLQTDRERGEVRRAIGSPAARCALRRGARASFARHHRHAGARVQVPRAAAALHGDQQRLRPQVNLLGGASARRPGGGRHHRGRYHLRLCLLAGRGRRLGKRPLLLGQGQPAAGRHGDRGLPGAAGGPGQEDAGQAQRYRPAAFLRMDAGADRGDPARSLAGLPRRVRPARHDRRGLSLFRGGWTSARPATSRR